MAKKGSIPKFGDWTKNNQAGTEYTMFFDSARNRRTGGGSSPYNPNFNPNDPNQNPEVLKQVPPQARREAGTERREERREEKREERRYRSPTPPPKGGQQRDERRRYHSPTPPAKVGNRSSAGIQGYGQQRTERDDAVLPAFGTWDETDPSSGSNYTGTFEKVGRQTRRERGEYVPTAPTYPDQHPQTPTRRKEKRHLCVIL